MRSFESIREIESVEIIAVGSEIRIIRRLRKRYGTERWRKLKGVAALRIIDESGEDYLYPADYFVVLDMPKDMAQIVSQSFIGNV